MSSHFTRRDLLKALGARFGTGGTTAAALDVLMGPDGMQSLLTRAVAAATKRSKELAK